MTKQDDSTPIPSFHDLNMERMYRDPAFSEQEWLAFDNWGFPTEAN